MSLRTINCPRAILARAIVLALVGADFGCTPDDTRDEVQVRMDDARARTIPPGARQLSFSGLQRDPMSVHATWEFEVDSSWGHYQLWIKTRLRREFTASTKTKPGVLFTMQLPGDTYNVDVDVLANGPPLRIRVTFIGRPS